MTATSSNNSDTKASSQRSSNNDRVSGGAVEAVRGTSSRLPSSPSPSPSPTTTPTNFPALKLSTAARKQSDQRTLQLAGVRLRDTSRRAAAMEKERVDVAAELKKLRKRERQLDEEIGPARAKVVVLEREVAEAKRDVVVTKVVAVLLEQDELERVLEEVVGRFGRRLVPVVVPVVDGERGGGGGETATVEMEVEVGVKSEGEEGVKLELGGGEREVTGSDGAVGLKVNSEVADKTVKRELNGGTNEVSEVSTDDEDADVGPAGSSGAKVASS